jgi:hypothetical protein
MARQPSGDEERSPTKNTKAQRGEDEVFFDRIAGLTGFERCNYLGSNAVNPVHPV